MTLRRLLISDFDGTITKRDFYECVLDRYATPQSQEAWDRYVAGELTHFEVLKRMFAELPADEQTVMEIARDTQVDPQLASGIRELQGHGWDVWVVSAGCGWYIERLLAERGIMPRLIANPGQLVPGFGLRMELPIGSPFLDPRTGINKAAVVEAAQTEYSQVAFAGDGRPDLQAAEKVPAELRFAKGWLAKVLEQRGQSFRRFEDWSDIVRGVTGASDEASAGGEC